MSLDQSGYIGGLQADAFHTKQDLLHQTGQTNKAKDALFDQQVINGNLGTNNQALMNGNAILADQNRQLKEILARPLVDIIDENVSLKNSLKEQKQLVAFWMLGQRSMKKVALDMARKCNASAQDVTDTNHENMKKVLDGYDLDGVADKEAMAFFLTHKNYLHKRLSK